MKISFIEPIGYCNGVKNAISLALNAKKENKDYEIKILGELVHNMNTVNYLKNNDIETVFLENEELKDYILKNKHNKIIYILSAHGTSLSFYDFLNENNIKFVDASCPIIKTINNKISNLNDENIIYLGKIGHIEANVSLSYFKNKPIFIDKNNVDLSKLDDLKEYLIINQSTIPLTLITKKMDENNFSYKTLDNFCPLFNKRFINLENNIVKYDFFIVVGDKNSSNANEIYLKIINKNKKAILIASKNDLNEEIIESIKDKNIAILSATSTNEIDVIDIKNYLDNYR